MRSRVVVSALKPVPVSGSLDAAQRRLYLARISSTVNISHLRSMAAEG